MNSPDPSVVSRSNSLVSQPILPTIRHNLPTIRNALPTIRDALPTIRDALPTIREASPTVKRPPISCHSERSEESLFLLARSNPGEIPRFARNDKISCSRCFHTNYFFRGLHRSRLQIVRTR